MFSGSSKGGKPAPWVVFSRWLVIGIIFLFIGYRLYADWSQVRSASLTIRPMTLLASVVVLAAYMFGRALVWHHLTGILGVSIHISQAVVAWLWSQLGKYVPGKVFLFLGRLHFYTRAGRSAGRVTLAFGIELVGTFLAAILAMLVAIIIVDVPTLRWHPLMAIGSAALLVAVLHPRVLDWAVRLGARAVRRQPFEVTLSYGRLLSFIALYVLNWQLLGAALFLLIRSFYPIEGGLVLYLTGAFAFASMVGMLAVIVPSGLGVREGLLALALSQVMAPALAIVAALVARIWFTGVELACAGGASAIASRRDVAANPRSASESETGSGT